MSIEKLPLAEVEQRLPSLTGWSVNNDMLYRCFEFNNFVEAFGFMTKVAIVAQAMDHHPEWFNVYKKVEIHLTTHEASGISERDFSLADKIDKLV